MDYILASKSPRRKELMKEISPIFNILTTEIDETKYICDDPIKSVEQISFHKGLDISKKYPNSIVVSADTIVVFNGRIFGKPKDEKDAFNILKKLSNNIHEVITGYTLFYKGKNLINHVISKVEFNNLNDSLILSYIESKSPLDKAGAYGIQDNEKFPIIKNIVGSYENIIGFPTKEIISDINRLIENN